MRSATPTSFGHDFFLSRSETSRVPLSLYFALILLLCLTEMGVRGESADAPTEGQKLEQQAKLAEQVGDLAREEVLRRQILERDPDSAEAHLDLVDVLDRMHRRPEALAECRRAVALHPLDPLALSWLGEFLVDQGDYTEAIPLLEKSIKLDSKDDSAAYNLAWALGQTGEKVRAAEVLETLLHQSDPKERPQVMDNIAAFYQDKDDPPSALLWWRRSADENDSAAARVLAWAYANGYGVEIDTKTAAYWSKHSAEGDRLIPRLAWLVSWAHGWGLVLLVILVSSILPAMAVLVVGFCFSRRLTKDPAIHWTERARRSYPFQIFLGFAFMVIPVIHGLSIVDFPGFALPVSKWLLGPMLFIFALVSLVLAGQIWERRFRTNQPPFKQRLVDVAAMIYLYGTYPLMIGVLGQTLPAQLGWNTLFVVLATVLAFLWIQFGGAVRLGRWLGLLAPADTELVEMAGSLARQWGLPPPSVWNFRWQRANAFALIYCNAIFVTKRLRLLLNRDELNAVLAHELGHLCEDWGTKFLRLIAPLLLLPVMLSFSLGEPFLWYGFAGSLVVFIGIFQLVQRRARRMEERADFFGQEAQGQEGAYAKALSKIYEDSLIPAVMAGKRAAHPHLYDRLVASGITPDYPRPKPPGKWGIMAGVLLTAVNALALSLLWHLLF